MPDKSQTMKNLFKGFSDYSENEYKEIWSDSIIVIDTNILLNFYRYSKETRNDMFKVLDSLKKRLWIPYYVGCEYFKNKNTVMQKSDNAYNEMFDKIIKNFESVKDGLNHADYKRIKCKEEIIQNLDEYIENNKKNFKELITREEEEKKKEASEENIEKKIYEYFDTKIGQPFDEKEDEEVIKEGKRRMENNIPPGFEDIKKQRDGEDIINGDYYIYYSIIKYAKEVNKHVIFITDDGKKDIFQEINGEKKGGRPELLNEFYKETNKLLLIYTAEGFLKAVEKNTANVVNDKTIKEIRDVRKINNDYYKSKYLDNSEEYYKFSIQNLRNRFSHGDINEGELKDYINKLLFYLNHNQKNSNKNDKYLFELERAYKKNDKNYMMHILNRILYENQSMYSDEENDNVFDYNYYHNILDMFGKIKYIIKTNSGEIKYDRVCSIIVDITDMLHSSKVLSGKRIMEIKRELRQLRDKIKYSEKYETEELDSIILITIDNIVEENFEKVI